MMHRLKLVTLLLVFSSFLIPVLGQETIVDEDFSIDPTGTWQLNGSALWDQANNRVVVTPALNGQAGSVFYTELIDINNFRLEATVKSCCGSGADGMAITFFQDDGSGITKIGNTGGGMCVTNMATGPQIVVEFDIWGNGEPCESCAEDPNTGAAGNHIGVEYSPTGFPGLPNGDCIPNDANANSACAGTGKIGFDLYGDYEFQIIVQVQDSMVTVDIGSEDLGIDMHRVITKEFTDYDSFEGIMGITASTGGANAEQSISYLKLESLPEGTCLIPPGTIARTITAPDTTNVQWEELPAWKLGTPVDVALEITDLRQASGKGCDVPTALTVEETLPEGWSADTISDGGTLTDGKITWLLTGAAVASGKILTYKAIPAGDPKISNFIGTFWETNIADPLIVGTVGDALINPIEDPGFDDAGFIKKWLFIGPFLQSSDVVTAGAGANPGVDIIALDYLTDGEINEITTLPQDGDDVVPDYNGESASSGLAPVMAITSQANPNRDGMTATWTKWLDDNDTITFDHGNAADDTDPTIFYQVWGTVDQAMCYGMVYVTNETENAIPCVIGAASDDSLQIILNGASILIVNVPRGAGGQHTIQNKVPALLNPGVNRLMVKVFEGGGAFQLRLRFQDYQGNPLTEGLSLSLDPPTGGCPIPPVSVTRTFSTSSSIPVEGTQTDAYIEGDDLDVSLSIDNVRQAGEGCDAAGDVTITEVLPQGWTASDITGGGSLQDNVITWTIAAGDLATTTELSYKAQGPVTASAMGIAGGIIETGNTLSFSVGGQSSFPTDFGIADDGYILKWLILGPLAQAGGAIPADDTIRLDYLTDGNEIDELSVMPQPDDEVETDFGGAAASTSLLIATNPDINPDGIPMWTEWYNSVALIDFQNVNLYNAQDGCMAYAVCYLNVDEDMDVIFSITHDDSAQILLDEDEVGIATGSVASSLVPADPITLTAGLHRLMVKIFEGGGAWNFNLRLQDASGNPITSGFSVSLSPGGTQPETISVFSGDTNNDGAVNLADAITLLSYLFASATPPPCMKSGDVNNDNAINLADAITVLSYQFSGGTLTAPDGTLLSSGDVGCHEYPKDTVTTMGCDASCK